MEYSPRKRGCYLRTTCSLVVLCVGLIASAESRAQQVGNTSGSDVDTEMIVVTGSRIQGQAPVGATVTTLDREAIENTGQVTLDHIIQEIPQVFDLGISENSTAQNGGTGNVSYTNSINLRGLGPFSTLIIFDGHRTSTNGRGISPSVIPTLGVERVEVIADGASAIYGSDAVAGVVNIIPRRNLDGIEAFARIGSTGNGDFWEWNAGIAIGKTFERGQVMVAYEHAFRDHINGSERDFFTSDQRPFGGPDYRVTSCAPGNMLYNGTNYALPEEYTQDNANSLVANSENRCDVLEGQDLFPKTSYDSVLGTLTYELFDNFELTFDGYYSRRKFARIPGAETQRFVVPESNAFFVAPSFYVPGSGGYTIDYSFRKDVENDTLAGYNEAWQVTPGIRAKLFDTWNFEAKVGTGTVLDIADSSGGIVAEAFNTAIASSDPATAFDPYGLGRTSAATIDGIFDTERNSVNRGELTTWQAGFDGPLFSLPGGEVKVAFGYERQDFSMLYGRTIPRNSKRTVNSGYVEIFLPIFGPDNATSGFEKLEFTGAVRYDKYSDVGDTTNPKFGLNWIPIEGIELRGSYGTSFRAPTFPEISGSSSYFYVQSYQNPDGAVLLSAYALGSGPNPDVRPETATTWTLGADFKPVDRLKLSVTYFDIDYRDTIAALLSNLAVLTYADEYAGTDVILYGQEAYDRINLYLQNGIQPEFDPPTVRPRGGSTACTDGGDGVGGLPPDPSACIYIDGRSINLGRSQMQGIDFTASYSMDIGPKDQLSLQASGTYLTNYKVTYTPTGAAVSTKNHIFNPLTFKARGAATWVHGPLSVRGQITFVNSYTNDLVTPAEKVDSFAPVDLSVTWQIGEDFNLPLKRLALTAEVRNAFDVSPPYVNAIPGANGGGGYDPTAHSVIGRFFSLAIRAGF